MRYPDEPRVIDGRKMVERMLTTGMSLEEIEGAIDKLATGEEAKSALWLGAWSRLPARGQSPLVQPAVRLGSNVRPVRKGSRARLVSVP
jgi:hypothetical protein